MELSVHKFLYTNAYQCFASCPRTCKNFNTMYTCLDVSSVWWIIASIIFVVVLSVVIPSIYYCARACCSNNNRKRENKTDPMITTLVYPQQQAVAYNQPQQYPYGGYN